MAGPSLSSELPDVLRRAERELSSAGIPWALVGGLAVSVHTEPRFTRDLDLAVAVEGDRQADHLIRGFRAAGFVVDTVLQQEAVDRFATARLRAPTPQRTFLDLLFSSSGIEPEIAEQAVRTEVFSGVTVPVANRGHLIALKILARDDQRRPQDSIDLRGLLTTATGEELAVAEESLRRIVRRGFHRGRDLLALYEEAKAEYLER